MSEVSVLSHEYKTAYEFSQRINQALILLKKSYLALPGGDEVTSQELVVKRRELAAVLGALIRRLDQTRPGVEKYDEKVQVPSAIVIQLREERRGDLEYFLEDLESTAIRLADPASDLTTEDLALLDQLASIADLQASRVYRRLMRK